MRLPQLKRRLHRPLRMRAVGSGRLPAFPLKSVRRVLLAILAAAVACLMIGYSPSQGRYWPVAAVLGLLLLYAIIHFLFLRCPHCGEWLGRYSGKLCRRCGRPIR